jgi:PGF-CTERM protein
MIDEDSMEDDPGMMMSDPPMTCGDDVMKVSMAEASAPGADIMFHDADSSGTISDGDMVHINPEIDAGGDWNTVRLYSASADKYSDENPMMTPGFGALAGIVALLGAALLARRD